MPYYPGEISVLRTKLAPFDTSVCLPPAAASVSHKKTTSGLKVVGEIKVKPKISQMCGGYDP